MTTSILKQNQSARSEVMKNILRVNAFPILEEMFRTSPDHVIIVDSLGNILMTSKGFKSVVQADYFSRQFSSVIHPVDVEKALQAHENGVSKPISFRVLCHDNNYIPVTVYHTSQTQDFCVMHMVVSDAESVSYKEDGVTFDKMDHNLWCIHSCGQVVKDQKPGKFLLIKGTAEAEYATFLGKARKVFKQGEPIEIKKSSNITLNGLMVKIS